MIFCYTINKYAQQFAFFTQRNPNNLRESFKQTYPSNLLEHIQNTSKILPKASQKAPQSVPFCGPGPTWEPKLTNGR